MSPESISYPYHSQHEEAAPSSDQRIVEVHYSGNVLPFTRPGTLNDAELLEVGERAYEHVDDILSGNHTQDEAMRDVTLDRTTKAARKQAEAIKSARDALEKIFGSTDIYSD